MPLYCLLTVGAVADGCTTVVFSQMVTHGLVVAGSLAVVYADMHNDVQQDSSCAQYVPVAVVFSVYAIALQSHGSRVSSPVDSVDQGFLCQVSLLCLEYLWHTV